MKTNTKEALYTIQKAFQKGVHEMLSKTIADWMHIYEVLQEQEIIEPHDIEVYLSRAVVNGKEQEVVVVKEEHANDFVLLWDTEKKDEITVYSFKHQHSKEENRDISIVMDILQKQTLDVYQPLYVIRNQYKEMESDTGFMNRISEVKNFYQVFANIQAALEIPKEYHMAWYHLERETSALFEDVFKKQKEHMIELYHLLKKSGDRVQIQDITCYLTSLQVEEIKEEKEKPKTKEEPIEEGEDEATNILLRLWRDAEKNKKPKTKEDHYRDGIVLECGDVQYVLVFQKVTHDESWIVENIHLHCCKTHDRNYEKLESFLHEYETYRLDRPIYEMFYEKDFGFQRGDVKREDRIIERYGSSHAVLYFTELQLFLQAFESICEKTKTENK